MPYTNFRLNESEVAASFGQLWGQCSIWRNSFDAKVGVAFSVTCLHLTVSSYYQHLLVLLLSIMPRCRWSNIYYRVLLCHFYVCNRRDVDVTNALSLVRCSCDQPFSVCFGRLPNPVSFFDLFTGNPQSFGQNSHRSWKHKSVKDTAWSFDMQYSVISAHCLCLHEVWTSLGT